MNNLKETQSITNIDNALKSLTEVYNLTTSEIVPTKINKRSSVPWWNYSLQDLRTKTNSLRRRYQKTRENVDWQAYKSTKKLYNQTIHKSKMDCFKNYCEDQHSPWNIIDNILTRNNKNKQIPLLKDPDSDPPEYTTLSFLTAKLLAKHMFLDNIRETDNAHHQRIREEVTNSLSSPLQTNIEQLKMTELQSSVFSLSPFKAPNPDDSIYPVMLQQTFDIVKHDLYVIVNNCLQLNYFPDYLKNAYTTVIKKGAKKPDDEVKSYRPVSLLPIIRKCIKKIIHKRLVNIAVSNEWISSKQFGFQEGKSCEMAVSKLVGRIESAFKS